VIVRIVDNPIPPQWMKNEHQPGNPQSPQSTPFSSFSALIPQPQLLLYTYIAITLIVCVSTMILQSLLILQSKGIVRPPNVVLKSEFHEQSVQLWFD
jgi:hypothetical protein